MKFEITKWLVVALVCLAGGSAFVACGTGNSTVPVSFTVKGAGN